tara:strand:- start:819418 stop:820116 length:699 start_codon:yes stop_codon:yes gene_type:complete
MTQPVDTRQVSYQLIFRALHDLQAPARHAKSFLSIFRESIDESKLSPESIEMLNAATKATDEMRDRFVSIRSVLSVPLVVETVSTIDLAEGITMAWDQVVAQHDGDFSRPEITGSATIDSDDVLVVNLLASLLDNSIRFRKPDVPLQIECRIVENADTVTVEIEDNGLGIDSDRVDWLIEPFNRGQHHDGLGLGLTRCMCISKTIGCHFTMQSDGESGTTVLLTFPKQIQEG